MQQLILSLKRRILINTEDGLYKIISSVLLAIGFAILCIICEITASIIFGLLYQGSFISNINSTQDLLAQLLLFSLPSTICFSILPIACFSIFLKWKAKDYGLSPCFKRRSLIIKGISVGLLAVSLVFLFNAYDLTTVSRMFLVFVFIAINEEILVRGILYKLLNSRFRKIASAVIASLIFAFFLHSAGDFFANFFVRFPLSLMLFSFYVASDDIYSSIMIHLAYNVFINSLA